MKSSYLKKNGLLLVLLLISFWAKAQETPALDTLTQRSQAVFEADTSGDSATEAQYTFVADTESVKTPSNKPNSGMWIPLIIALLSLAGVIYLFLKKADKQSVGPKADFYKKDFEIGTQEIQQEIQALKDQQAALEGRIKTLEAKTTEKAEEVPLKETEPVAAVPLKDEIPSPLKTWYSVAPKNGIFFARQLAETFKAREHIYRIEVLDEAHAYYYLVDDNATRQHAFNIPDSYILPAMEVDGTGRLAEASQVDIQRGSLVKAGNNWQIEEKAVLNYSI